MIKKIVVYLCICFLVPVVAVAQDSISLWPKGKMPNSRGLDLKHIEERERITQVSEPKMLVFFPPKEEQNGTSILILPSGGYQKLTYNLGGIQLAKWFNTQGITAFVLLYRLPNSPDLIVSEQGPVQDAQRAMKIIRHQAKTWNLNPDKVGIFGSSAGGHLASTIATHVTDFSKIGDKTDDVSFKPDFMVLVSPVISFGKFTHEGSKNNFLGKQTSFENVHYYSNENHVSVHTPPTILFHAQNDEAVNPMNSLLFYQSMLKHQVPGALHIFPKGGHSIGIYNASNLTDQWKTLTNLWLKEINIIE